MKELLRLFKRMQELNDDPSNSSWYRLIIHPNGQAYLVKCPGKLQFLGNNDEESREPVDRIVASIDMSGSLPTKAGQRAEILI